MKWYERVGRDLATGGLAEAPYLVDKYITGGSEAAGKAAAAQRQSLDAAMKRLQEFSQQQYQNRQRDLSATMAFYGPAERYLQSIYSQPPPGAGGPPGMGAAGSMPPPPGFPKPQGPPPVGGMFGAPRRGY